MPKVNQIDRTRGYIGHILRYCIQIEDTLNEIGYSRESFISTHTYPNAVAMCLLQIGELTKRLPPDFLNAHASIPWSLIARTRDLYAHHYGSTDPEMIWNTAVDDIPPLKKFCERYLNG